MDSPPFMDDFRLELPCPPCPVRGLRAIYAKNPTNTELKNTMIKFNSKPEFLGAVHCYRVGAPRILNKNDQTWLHNPHDTSIVSSSRRWNEGLQIFPRFDGDFPIQNILWNSKTVT